MSPLLRSLCSVAYALSVFAPAVAANARSEGATIVVNEIPVVTLRASVAGKTPEERAELVAKRINACNQLSKVSTSKLGEYWALMAPEGVLLQIDPKDSQANGTPIDSLAETWKGVLQKALDLPPLRLATTSTQLRVGAQTTVGFVGSEAASANLTVSDPSVLRVERGTGKLLLTAVSRGQATLTIAGSKDSLNVTVTAVPPAASFPKVIVADVVGFPASAQTVSDAALGAINHQAQLEPGGRLTVDVPETSALPLALSRTVKVRTKAAAPNCYDVASEVEVIVKNSPIARKAEGEFWYCNNPESVRRPQNLFSAPLRQELPVRMLYHHINESPSALYLKVGVYNSSDREARVVVIPGDSVPDKNPALAGLMAAEPFLKGWSSGSGEIITIPAKTMVPLSFRRLAPKDTASGLCYLRLLADGPQDVQVVTDAVAPEMVNSTWAALTASPTPWHLIAPQTFDASAASGASSEYVFAQPFCEDRVEYTVGGNFGFLFLGSKPIVRLDGGRALDGNFGVTYSIKANATNPTDKPAWVEVVFETSAGYSAGLFVVDGQPRSIRPIQPKTVVQLAKFRLEPGKSRQVLLTTIPLSGSCYPATISVRPVHDLPLTTMPLSR